MVNTNLIGLYLEQIVLQNKYNFNLSNDIVFSNITRLTNQIWKLIPMRENGEDWAKQLDTVIIDIAGFGEIFLKNPLFLQLLSKLEGIKHYNEIEFELFRKTIFESINLIQVLKREFE